MSCIDWAKLSRVLPRHPDRIHSPKRSIFNKNNRTMVNAKNTNLSIKRRQKFLYLVTMHIISVQFPLFCRLVA
jgi:hypothetical protein